MVIAFCGQKGGIGKSTTAIAVAAELHARGRRVLLVDADPQGTVTTWAHKATEKGQPTPTVVAMGPRLHSELESLEHHDVTIIDCPGRLGEIQRAALMVTDLAVLPCGPSGPDAWALTESVDLVTEAQGIRPELRAAVLVTRKKPRTTIGEAARGALGAWGLRVLKTEICERVAYEEAVTDGQGVVQYQPDGAAAAEVRALVKELLREVSK